MRIDITHLISHCVGLLQQVTASVVLRLFREHQTDSVDVNCLPLMYSAHALRYWLVV